MPSPFLGAKKDSIATILASAGKSGMDSTPEPESSVGKDAGHMAMKALMKSISEGNAEKAYMAFKNLMDICDMDTEDSDSQMD